MNQQTQPNPLAQFYRTEEFRVKLPSRGNFYDDSVVNLDEDFEVGIMAMTANDEILLKNPDALLSGKALSTVIKSCVPDVKRPEKLLICDIDTLMIAIRRASYGDEADLGVSCPECNHENTFGLDLETLINHTESLDSSYEVILPQGLTVFLRPGSYETMLKQYKVAFENVKAQRAMATTMADEDAALQILSKAFKHLTKLNFEIIKDSIIKIVFTDNEGNEQEIDNKKHIAEFIQNVSKSSIDIVEDKIGEINKVGIQKELDAKCSECGHTWKSAIEFNPVNFSTGS